MRDLFHGANVTPSAFGKIGFLPTDGRVDAQPLFLADVPIGKATHNVLYIVTEHDSVYAYDADTQALLWQATASGSGRNHQRRPPMSRPSLRRSESLQLR